MRYLNFQSSISLFLYCREHSQTLWLWKGINLNTVHEYLFHKIAENIRDSVCFTYSSQQNGNEKHTQRIGIHPLLRILLQQRPNMKFPEGREQTGYIMNTHSGSIFKGMSVSGLHTGVDDSDRNRLSMNSLLRHNLRHAGPSINSFVA